ncbi:MAG: glycosyl hydrolase family 18 protein [Candidatus Pacebacteria bacterium]|nr:glycosyl hydrolase family 18 protein [Candidatus Paceibacterota bacterium]
MLKIYKKIILFSILSALTLSPFSIFAAGAVQPTTAPYKPLKIFYYREGKNARASLYGNELDIGVLAPQAYTFKTDGTLTGTMNQTVINYALNKGIKLMPLVTNPNFSKAGAHSFLDDSSQQDKAIDGLIAEAKTKGYWGWQIDFEQMDLSYRDKFSAFVQKFGDQMKANGLVSSVAVVSKFSENPSDYVKTLWQDLIGVYDYSALASHTDFLSIMSYDDPDSEGPVARYSWLKKVMDYTLTLVPKEKVSMGLAFYYWLWNDTTGKIVEIGGNGGIQEALKKHYMTSGFDVAEQAPYFKYTSNKKKYTLWYESGRSIQAKLDLMKKYRLAGFSAWALGLEVPSVKKVL